MLLILRQVIGDGEPARLRTDEDVLGWTNGWVVDERSHGDMDVGAVAHERIKQGAALAAMRVVAALVAEDQEFVLAFGEEKLSRSIPAKGLNAEPVVRRQSEQWQFAA